MNHGIGEPPLEPPPDERPSPSKWRPEEITTAVESTRPTDQYRPQGGLDGCLAAIGKGILILVIGVFVLGGLVFATCFLGLQR